MISCFAISAVSVLLAKGLNLGDFSENVHGNHQPIDACVFAHRYAVFRLAFGFRNLAMASPVE